jgi:hypothetical protein
MAERWPPAQQYRNAFECVKESILEYISSGVNISQGPLPSSTFDIATQDALKEVFASTGMESLGQAFNSIITVGENGASESLYFDNTEEDQLVFGLDNLGSMAPVEERLVREEVGNQQAHDFNLGEGAEYNWDILDSVNTSRGQDSGL